MIYLYPHQQKALDLTKDKKQVAYYIDMGLGKTFIGSEKVRLIGLKTLVVCQKSKMKDWMEHFKTYYNFDVYDLTKKDNIAKFINSNMSVGVINYDLIFRRVELQNLSHFTLMLDESSLIGNHKAKRTRFITAMLPDAVVLLSGTPGKYEKLWSQCKLLNWPISKMAFDTRYINYISKDFHVGFPVKVIDKRDPYRNVDELKEKLREHGAVFMKTEEVMDLPEQNFIDVKITQTSEYKKFLKDKIITINDEELVGDHTFRKYLYKRQLCSIYNQEKIDALKDLLDSTDDRVIIFYTWNKELSIIKSLVGDRPISEVNGHTKDLTNYETYDDSITLVQYQSGAKGLNLQKANKMVFFTPTDKSDDYQQAIKRIHRIGQKTTCFYYRLIVENSIEMDIYRALEKQQDYTDYLFEED